MSPSNYALQMHYKSSMNKKVQKHFPILKKHKKFVYLDSAATSLTPKPVLEKMNEYYTKYGVNINRGLYELSDRATQEYERAREKVASFINADTDEVIFTSGTTCGLNMLASSIGKTLGPGDNVVLTEYEHHANLIPWQEAARQFGFTLKFLPLSTSDWRLETGDLIDENTKVVSFAHISNSLGIVTDAEALIEKAKEVGAITIVDAAQSIVHMPIDVKQLDCDFLVFSGHKLYGPTGIGVLYGKKDLLEKLEPATFGGDMIQNVDYHSASWRGAPHKFEAGTPNIAGAIGLGSAIDFITDIGFDNITEHGKALTHTLIHSLHKINGLSIAGPQTPENRSPVVSFTIDGVHPHDIAEIFSRHSIAIRAGHHCTQPLMKKLGVPGTARISLGMYNTEEDIDKAIHAIKEVISIFS